MIYIDLYTTVYEIYRSVGPLGGTFKVHNMILEL